MYNNQLIAILKSSICITLTLYIIIISLMCLKCDGLH